MTTQRLILAALLFCSSTVLGCGDDDDAPATDGGSVDMHVTDAGPVDMRVATDAGPHARIHGTVTWTGPSMGKLMMVLTPNAGGAPPFGAVLSVPMVTSPYAYSFDNVPIGAGQWYLAGYLDVGTASPTGPGAEDPVGARAEPIPVVNGADVTVDLTLAVRPAP